MQLGHTQYHLFWFDWGGHTVKHIVSETVITYYVAL